ncbi:MAG TPA: response regulator transcription factor [Paludibacter sp.]
MTEILNILFVDSDFENYKSIRNGLENKEIYLYYASTAHDSLELFYKNNYRLIVMDILLEDNDIRTGLELLSIFRSAKSTPILVISSKCDVSDKVTSLKMGADDYITKPFDFEECMARINTLIRRFTKPDNDYHSFAICFRHLVINPDYREVSINGIYIGLTCKEFDLLYFLANNSGKVFSKEQIYEYLWNEQYYEADNSIMCQVHKLRKKIEPDPNNPIYIQTVRGVGYRFSSQ